MTAPLPATTRIQLALLAELAAVLGAGRMRAWLRGGWALDFLLGQVTRPHSDIDLITWARHRTRVQRLLPTRGFTLAQTFPVQSDFVKRGQTISIVFVALGPDGRVVVPAIPDWTWHAGALTARKRTLGDVSWRVMSAEQLLDEKERYEAGTGSPPRPRDLESMEQLRRLIASRPAGSRPREVGPEHGVAGP